MLIPLLIVIIAVLKFSGEGEIFFFQDRIGFRNQSFKITKFATMLKSAANMARGDFAVRNDPRVLPVGKFLRKSKINELLQFWDVLRGRMSIVGPRPQIESVHSAYSDEYKSILFFLKPGITGLGSLVFRNEDDIINNAYDKEVCFYCQILPYKIELELWYAANRNITMDIKIIIITFLSILVPNNGLIWHILPKDIYRDVSKFDGILK
jgi:lipopolysaccharide/colanic/teichoic acid biosynthesis glycosyltransferase